MCKCTSKVLTENEKKNPELVPNPKNVYEIDLVTQKHNSSQTYTKSKEKINDSKMYHSM